MSFGITLGAVIVLTLTPSRLTAMTRARNISMTLALAETQGSKMHAASFGCIAREVSTDRIFEQSPWPAGM